MKKETEHQRHEYTFKQQSGDLSTSISRSVAEPDTHQRHVCN